MRVATPLAALLVAATPALADHVAGHDHSDPVFPVLLPDQMFFDGGAAFFTAIGPDAGSVITNATFDITYVSDGATPASELRIAASIIADEGFLEVVVTGADLGFGSGPGTFHGTFSTSALNGTPVPSFFLPPPATQVNLDIGATTGAIAGSGYFDPASRINLDIIPVPAPTSAALAGIGVAFALRRRR